MDFAARCPVPKPTIIRVTLKMARQVKIPDNETLAIMMIGDVEIPDDIKIDILVSDDIIFKIKVVVLKITVTSKKDPIMSDINLPYNRINEDGFVETKMAELAKGVAHFVYEYDPRIGSGYLDQFQTSPLFDPSYIGHPVSELLEAMRNGLSTQDDDLVEISCCHICGLQNDESSWWGGGNLLFVHDRCLSREP